MTVRVRFAPSPTGQIHIGNIRTAIFNWLYARNQGGRFILRIEDTDQQRSAKDFEEIILQELAWLNLDIDEGIGKGGAYGPYRQMERTEIYNRHAQLLEEMELAYPCFCNSSLHNEDESDEQKLAECSCRFLEREAVEAKCNEGKPFALRFKNSNEGTISFNDLIRGEITFKAALLGDFVLMKSDGTPTYNFACAVDDHLMAITHVLRGEDHISNTPKQLLLYHAFGWEAPRFGHLPLILDKNKHRLSKRAGEQEVYLGRYRERGYLPEAIFNFLALLGWSAGEEEIFSREEMVKRFNLDRINQSAAIFDVEKLKWMNGVYLRSLSPQNLFLRARPFLEEYGVTWPPNRISHLLVALVKNAATMQELVEKADGYTLPLSYDQQTKEELIKLTRREEVQNALRALAKALEGLQEIDLETVGELLTVATKEQGIKPGKVFKPLRLALTAAGSGPDLQHIIAFLGPQLCRDRLLQALEADGNG